MYPLCASKSLLIPVCTLIVLIKLAIDHLIPGTQYKDKRVLGGGGVEWEWLQLFILYCGCHVIQGYDQADFTGHE